MSKQAPGNVSLSEGRGTTLLLCYTSTKTLERKEGEREGEREKKEREWDEKEKAREITKRKKDMTMLKGEQEERDGEQSNEAAKKRRVISVAATKGERGRGADQPLDAGIHSTVRES